MARVATDDYMAVEVTDSGHVKLTVDMGAHLGAGMSGNTSPMTIESNHPIAYGIILKHFHLNKY